MSPGYMGRNWVIKFVTFPCLVMALRTGSFGTMLIMEFYNKVWLLVVDFKESWVWTSKIFWRNIWEFMHPSKSVYFCVEDGARASTYQCEDCLDILKHGGMDDRLLNSVCVSGIDWLESAMILLDRKAFDCLNIILWNI